jgi:hypothetical protein
MGNCESALNCTAPAGLDADPDIVGVGVIKYRLFKALSANAQDMSSLPSSQHSLPSELSYSDTCQTAARMGLGVWWKRAMNGSISQALGLHFHTFKQKFQSNKSYCSHVIIPGTMFDRRIFQEIMRRALLTGSIIRIWGLYK